MEIEKCLSKHFRLVLYYCCAAGWVLPLPWNKVQLAHSPWKATGWRGSGLQSLISICAYRQELCKHKILFILIKCVDSYGAFIHLGFWTTNYLGQSTAAVQHK